MESMITHRWTINSRGLTLKKREGTVLDCYLMDYTAHMEKNCTLNIPRMREQVAESGRDCLGCMRAFRAPNCQEPFLEERKREGDL